MFRSRRILSPQYMLISVKLQPIIFLGFHYLVEIFMKQLLWFSLLSSSPPKLRHDLEEVSQRAVSSIVLKPWPALFDPVNNPYEVLMTVPTLMMRTLGLRMLN